MERVLGPEHAEVAECCNALAMLQKKEGDYGQAKENYSRALKIVSERFGAQHPKIGIYSVNLGDIFRKTGEWAEAESAYERALPILERALGPDNMEVAEALNSQGLVLKKKADYDRAEVLYRRALQIVLKTFDKSHYKYGMISNNLGDCYRKRGQFQQALEIYEEALSSLTVSLGVQHSETAEVQHNVGMVLHQLGRYQDAVDLFNKAIAVILKEFGAAHYKMGVFQNNAGLSYAMLGNYPRAHALLSVSLDILKKKLGDEHIEVADVLSSLGDVCMKLFVQMNAKSKLAEAHAAYKEANRIVLASLGASHPKSVSFQSLLAICESMQQTTDTRPIELVQVVLYDVSGSMETKTQLAAKGSVLDRREISKAFFGAFIDKEIAYRMPHALGLVTFGDVVTTELPITREFESFAALFGEISKLQPATHLLDAVVTASKLVAEFCKTHAAELAPHCTRRVLCLSDGEDSGSSSTPEKALQALTDAKCILDSVPIEGAHAKMRALSNASGGLCFLVKSFEEGLTLFESEAVLSLRHRVPHKTPAIGGRKVEQLVEDVPYCQKPPFLLPPLLDAALARRKAAVPRSLASETVKRLSYELQQLLLEPEPCFEVASEDLSFWTVFFTGAAGTPYEQRCFLLFIDFELFPALAPEVRFVSPVYHCNVNNDGRSCLDVLSTWNPESSVRAILKEIAKLMACPNSHAAIDSVKGSLFQENRALYLSNAREWAAKHGKATSKDFLKK